MYKLILAMAFIFSASVLGYDNSFEVDALNKEFNGNHQYPIIIFDKSEVKGLITNKEYSEQILIIKNYVESNFNLKLNNHEADAVLSYHTTFDSAASALPFMTADNSKYKFCAVFPSGVSTSLHEEIKRNLGIANLFNPYPSEIEFKLENKLDLEELRLISLYHELAHCLDKRFIPNSKNPSSYEIHQAESFAEVLALLMLDKRKKLSNLALKRVVQRSLYTKYMGKFLATNKDIIFLDKAMRDGGLIYFLTPSILAANKLMNQFDYRISTSETSKLIIYAENIVLDNALTSREFAALRIYLKEGRDTTIKQYKELAIKSPSYFFETYLNLKLYIDIIEEVDLFL